MTNMEKFKAAAKAKISDLEHQDDADFARHIEGAVEVVARMGDISRGIDSLNLDSVATAAWVHADAIDLDKIKTVLGEITEQALDSGAYDDQAPV